MRRATGSGMRGDSGSSFLSFHGRGGVCLVEGLEFISYTQDHTRTGIVMLESGHAREIPTETAGLQLDTQPHLGLAFIADAFRTLSSINLSNDSYRVDKRRDKSNAV